MAEGVGNSYVLTVTLHLARNGLGASLSPPSSSAWPKSGGKTDQVRIS